MLSCKNVCVLLSPVRPHSNPTIHPSRRPQIYSPTIQTIILSSINSSINQTILLPSIHPSTNQTILPSINFSINQSTHPPTKPFFNPPILPSVYLSSSYQFIHEPNHPPSTKLLIHPSIHQPTKASTPRSVVCIFRHCGNAYCSSGRHRCESR